MPVLNWSTMLDGRLHRIWCVPTVGRVNMIS
jgi:hypothetical protein